MRRFLMVLVALSLTGVSPLLSGCKDEKTDESSIFQESKDDEQARLDAMKAAKNPYKFEPKFGEPKFGSSAEKP